MPTSLKPIKPFFDDSSTLTVKLFNGACYPATLLTEEALSPVGLDIVTPIRITIFSPSEGLPLPCSHHTTPTPEFCLASHQGSHHATPIPGNHTSTPNYGTPAHTPYPKIVGFQWATSISSEVCLTSCESSLDAASSTLPDDFKIPKPQGEPGHPGCGGYMLESTLNWNHNLSVRFKASLFLHAAMHTYLVKLDHHLLPYRQTFRYH
jgi:hypothetical protein